MDTRRNGAAKRLILSLAAGVALSGCAAYGPPYTAYDPATGVAPYYYGYPYGYGYGYPTYVGPPISLSFGYYEHRYHGGHGWHGGHHGHGWHGGHGGHGWHGGGGGHHGGGHGRH
jgi:hypothetical protein